MLLSLRQAAEELECDRTTLAKRLRDLGIAPADGERYRLKDIARALKNNGDPDRMTPYERQAHYKAEAERMRLDVERGRLVVASDVAIEWARVIKGWLLEIEVFPDEVERDVGASPAVIQKLEAKFNQLRERIYKRIADPETKDGGAGPVPPSA